MKVLIKSQDAEREKKKKRRNIKAVLRLVSSSVGQCSGLSQRFMSCKRMLRQHTRTHTSRLAAREREREIQRLREGTGKNETPVGGGDDLLFISVCGILTPSSDPFLIASVSLSRHRRLLGHASSWSASEVHLAANQRAAWRGVKLNPSNAARTVLERAGEDEPAADVCVCASMCVLGCYQSCRLPATDEVIRPFSKADFFPPVRFG